MEFQLLYSMYHSMVYFNYVYSDICGLCVAGCCASTRTDSSCGCCATNTPCGGVCACVIPSASTLDRHYVLELCYLDPLCDCVPLYAAVCVLVTLQHCDFALSSYAGVSLLLLLDSDFESFGSLDLSTLLSGTSPCGLLDNDASRHMLIDIHSLVVPVEFDLCSWWWSFGPAQMIDIRASSRASCNAFASALIVDLTLTLSLGGHQHGFIYSQFDEPMQSIYYGLCSHDFDCLGLWSLVTILYNSSRALCDAIAFGSLAATVAIERSGLWHQ